MLAGMIGRQDLLIDLPRLGSKGLRQDLQLGNDIDERADAALELQEFVEHDHLFLLENTVTALEITSFITHDVFRFIEDPFDLI